MQPPFMPPQKTITTDDLHELYAFMQSLQFTGDNKYISIDHDQSGVVVRLTDEPDSQESAGGGTTTNVLPCKIQSGSKGIYTGIILNDDGTETTEPEEIQLITVLATGWDLPPQSYVAGLVLEAETLGGNP